MNSRSGWKQNIAPDSNVSPHFLKVARRDVGQQQQQHRDREHRIHQAQYIVPTITEQHLYLLLE